VRAATVDFAVKRIKREILPRYKNVDDVVAIAHHYGCGVAIDAPARLFHPHAAQLKPEPELCGEIFMVSLGCEKLQPTRMIPVSELNVLEERRP